MRIILCFLLFSVLLNCNEAPKRTIETTTKKEPEAVKKEDIKDTIKDAKNDFLPLNDANAMEFFLEYEKENKENKVRIYTDFGNIDIQLFEDTKFHRANFIFLTKNKIFDGTQFHRVVKNFVIQGGNTDNKKIAGKRRKIGKYLLPPDTKRGYKHHRGVISMPSSEIEDAYKLASPYEFFITQTNQYHLDGKYTIFGKVINGMDVVDKIASQETDGGDWPRHNIYINKVEIIK